jgi:hypothetical protein
MNTFFNDKQITKENFLNMIQNCIEDGWKNCDLFEETKIALEKIYHGEYDGVEEDIEYILDKLNSKSKWGYLYPNANLQDVETIISRGEWYFQE